VAQTPHDGAATVLTLGGVGYTVTNIVLTNNRAPNQEKILVAHLGQTVGQTALQIDPPLFVPDPNGDTGRQVSFNYLGRVQILDGLTGSSFSISVAGTSLLNKPFTVLSSTLTLAVNDAVRGEATVIVGR
jgi:hypothetical protein